jgi:hypothetical protein
MNNKPSGTYGSVEEVICDLSLFLLFYLNYCFHLKIEIRDQYKMCHK